MLRKIFLFIIITAAILSYIRAEASLCPGAVAAVLIETGSDTVLYEKNAHSPMPMASTTKIMTALCALENGNPDKTVETDIRAYGVEGSSIYLKKGEKLTLRDLIYGLMLHSGNDAAVAIACEISGSPESFAQLMNETAKKIGALNTNFENPNGLDGKNHYTTAYDLAIITSYALKNPNFAEIVSTYKKTITNADGEERFLKNHNKLLATYEGCTGVKTGFTKKSGRCLVSSAKRGNTELVAVTLNDGDDWRDHAGMLNYGFENTEAECVLKKGEYLKTVEVKNGNKSTVKIICDDDIYVTRIKGRDNQITFEYDIPSELDAPVEYGSIAGRVSIIMEGKPVAGAKAVTADASGLKARFESLSNFGMLLREWLSITSENNGCMPSKGFFEKDE